MRFRRQSTGERLDLDGGLELGVGGEATVFDVPGPGDLAAKIYHRPTPARSAKLAAMLAAPPDDPAAPAGQGAIAWPVDLLLREDGATETAGFLMRRVSGASLLLDFYNPRARLQRHPLFDWRHLLRAAGNLASAVHSLHRGGYVIGDVNESNVLVSSTALVTLVDTDSFQVPDRASGTVHRCPVGKPEFTPPELQQVDFHGIDRGPEHDAFGLAVLIFRLLMEGNHPFDGVYSGMGEPAPIEERIAAGFFPHGAKRGPYRRKPLAPPFDLLDPAVAALFLQCFGQGHSDPSRRPGAERWWQVLAAAERNLVACVANPQHVYDRHLPTCPWCERMELMGLDPFPSREEVEAGRHLRKPAAKPVAATPVASPRATAAARGSRAPAVNLPAAGALGLAIGALMTSGGRGVSGMGEIDVVLAFALALLWVARDAPIFALTASGTLLGGLALVALAGAPSFWLPVAMAAAAEWAALVGRTRAFKQGWRGRLGANLALALALLALGSDFFHRSPVASETPESEAQAITVVPPSGPPPGKPWTIPDLKLALVPIQAGQFAMGSDKGQPDEKPITRVTITQPFWMGKTLVTQAQWRAVMGGNPSFFHGDNLPVETVWWHDAMAFCRELTARERAAGRLPTDYTYVLPTEAQWEWAARAGTIGDDTGVNNRTAWDVRNSPRGPQPVALLGANAWGLMDIRGNVWEWCLDLYASKLPGGKMTDPPGSWVGNRRVARGGAWDTNPAACRFTARLASAPDESNSDVGFRIALSQPMPNAPPTSGVSWPVVRFRAPDGGPSDTPATPPLPAADQAWKNSLWMEFAPLHGRGALLAAHDTGQRAYLIFTTENRIDWTPPPLPQGDVDPIVNVSLDDARAFCAWLTHMERTVGRLGPNQAYRLPTDAEWMAATNGSGSARPPEGGFRCLLDLAISNPVGPTSGAR